MLALGAKGLVNAVLRNCLRRPTDSLYRYGGEEFTVILADTDEKGADHIASRIMRAIQNLCLPHKDSPYKQVTVSIGVAVWPIMSIRPGATILPWASMMVSCPVGEAS